MNSFHPSRWSLSLYLWVGVGLAVVNLFGPKGMLHWILLKQERSRLEAQLAESERDVVKIEAEMKDFRASRYARERAIRTELGYLAPDEYSVEILDETALH